MTPRDWTVTIHAGGNPYSVVVWMILGAFVVGSVADWVLP